MNLINFVLVFVHWCIDFTLRAKHKLIAKSSLLFHASSTIKMNYKSDSQKVGYEENISKLISNSHQLGKFRRDFKYRMVLEHVSYWQGLSYQKRISELGYVEDRLIMKLASSDDFGSPRKYKYKNIGWISPTLLRYISVYSEIEQSIGFSGIKSVVEIGVGYGGQARVINHLSKIQDYSMYDLEGVQELALRFLRETSSDFAPTCLNIRKVEQSDYDLVISNYAISELPIHVQEEYLEKILKSSKHIYLIMNSGASNATGRSEGKLSQACFLERLPGLKIQSELPSTGPDNYVLLR